MSNSDQHSMKKTISIKRYRPLFDVLKVEVDDNWDDMRKMLAVLTGGDNVNHIKHCVKYDLLSPLLVLQRIKTFAEKEEPFPFSVSDIEILYSELNQCVDTCLSGLKGLEKQSSKLDELLLLMFLLGTQVGVINIQDMALSGREAIKQKYRAGDKAGKKKSAKGADRKRAYQSALARAEKPTVGSLRTYLKSLNGERFKTGVDGCAEIWLDNNNFYDSQGQFSDSSISKIKLP